MISRSQTRRSVDETRVKVVLLGGPAVGKSSLCRCLKSSDEDSRIPNDQDPCSEKRVSFNGRTVKLGIWDRKGEDRFSKIPKSYYRDAQAAIIVYDITNARTWEQAKSWVKDLKAKKKKKGSSIVIALVGNKLDMVRCDTADEATAGSFDATSISSIESDRQVFKEDVRTYAKDEGLLFVETSATMGLNVDRVFEDIVKMINPDQLVAAHQSGGRSLRGSIAKLLCCGCYAC